MGYTVTAPVRSKQAWSKMLAFLERNYRTWPALNGRPKGASYIRGPIGDDFSYDHGKQRIGFDYNCFGGEREYMLALVRWIALRVGRKRGGRPYYLYDGGLEGVIGIVLKKPIPKEATLTDRWGVPIDPGPKYYDLSPRWHVAWTLEICEEPNALSVIRAEIQRLDALWERASTEGAHDRAQGG